VSLVQWINFPSLGDERGSLVALEGAKTVPFEIKRVYYIFGTQPGVARGFHAHRNLRQVAVCVTGKCRMVLDDGDKREEAWLDSPTKGLVIGDMVWREMHDFSSDCVLLVLASEHYDETDYIRSYEDFCVNRANSVELVSYDLGFLDLSWIWLNDPEVRRLTMTPLFTRTQQIDFFKELGSRKDYIIFGVTLSERRIGACGLKCFQAGMAELWLYIGEKDLWGKGLGGCILLKLEEKARSIGLQGLFLKVSKENVAAQKLYLKNGFHILKESDDGTINLMEKVF
jgi:RimJ/RimL family protein N-acetyltransferase/dTDP-4-dehydrorhamnose 3,5-epimerase-like enzyme